MKVKFISYGYKYYEAEGKAPPEHDFLFNLRDLPNPYWREELRPFTGLEKPVIEFFEENEITQQRLSELKNMVLGFILDFLNNESRTPSDSVIFAFRCTGGKHRSIYFSQNIYDSLLGDDTILNLNRMNTCDFELEHLELPRYQTIKV